MAATQRRRDGSSAISTSLAISRAIVDRQASSAARINGAETRVEAQIDDVVARIGARVYADASAHQDQCASGKAERSGSACPASSATLCMDCKVRPAGAVGKSGSKFAIVCQTCFDAGQRSLDASLSRTDAMLARLSESMAKPKPPVMVEGMRLVCTCGCDQFTSVKPAADEPEVNFKGHRGGYECDDCSKFFERDAATHDD